MAKGQKLLGMGSGQPNRVKSVQIALEKAAEEVKVRAVHALLCALCALWRFGRPAACSLPSPAPVSSQPTLSLMLFMVEGLRYSGTSPFFQASSVPPPRPSSSLPAGAGLCAGQRRLLPLQLERLGGDCVQGGRGGHCAPRWLGARGAEGLLSPSPLLSSTRFSLVAVWLCSTTVTPFQSG